MTEQDFRSGSPSAARLKICCRRPARSPAGIVRVISLTALPGGIVGAQRGQVPSLRPHSHKGAEPTSEPLVCISGKTPRGSVAFLLFFFPLPATMCSLYFPETLKGRQNAVRLARGSFSPIPDDVEGAPCHLPVLFCPTIDRGSLGAADR